MTSRSYKNLAVAWVPDSHEKRSFYIICAVSLLVVIVLALIISALEVPPKERKQRTVVPERVAKFITQKKKAEPTPPPVVATPTPRPIPSPKPKVARKKPEEAEKKPLTESEKKARDKASESGLLALGSEIADLIDTSDVNDLLNKKTRKSSGSASEVAALNTDSLTAGASKGSGGVNSSDYVGNIGGGGKLSEREVALVKSSLTKSDRVAKKGGTDASSGGSGERTGKVRTEEEVTIVFDQNKGQLFSIYNRERRKKPGLKGKIVLEITINAAGDVVQVKVASSELNDASLERRIVSRVKQFKFEPKDVETVTVTFPIEFLPS